MPTKFVKTKWIGSAACLTVFTLAPLSSSTAKAAGPAAAPTPAPAPAAAPAAPAPAPALPSIQVGGSGGATDGLGNAAGTGFDYLYNKKAGKGTAAEGYFQAKEVAASKAIAREAAGDRISDQQMLTAFIKYLGMSAVSDDVSKAYNADTKATLDLLHDKKTFQAWQKLHDLAQYTTFDAGISDELANRVSSIWQAGQTTTVLAQQNVAYQQQIADANNNADSISKEVQREQIEYAKAMKGLGGNQSRGNNNNNQNSNSSNNNSSTNTSGGAAATTATPSVDSLTTPPPSVTPYMSKMELTQEVMNSMESKARMKLNEIKANRLLDATETDFQKYIADLTKRKYYRNVLLAADFYRSLFDEGDYPVDVATQVNASLAANRDVLDSIDVFKNKIASNEIAAATDELETAFMTDQYHPALLTIPREMKSKVEKFIIDLTKMENMIEARDYGSLDPLLEDLQRLAPDFDATKARSLVTAVKGGSTMHLRRAQMLAQSKEPGDSEKALLEFQDAMDLWPGNPELASMSGQYFDANNTVSQYLTEFDRLVADKNYRGIFDKQYSFAPVTKDDPARLAQLKDALGKVVAADTAVAKASAQQGAGDYSGAWETIEIACKALPDDNKLNNMRGDLAGKASEFVSAINKAKESEGKGELGFSLTWYSIAQRHYPASTMANEAITRISQQILDKTAI